MLGLDYSTLNSQEWRVFTVTGSRATGNGKKNSRRRKIKTRLKRMTWTPRINVMKGTIPNKSLNYYYEFDII